MSEPESLQSPSRDRASPFGHRRRLRGTTERQRRPMNILERRASSEQARVRDVPYQVDPPPLTIVDIGQLLHLHCAVTVVNDNVRDVVRLCKQKCQLCRATQMILVLLLHALQKGIRVHTIAESLGGLEVETTVCTDFGGVRPTLLAAASLFTSYFG